MGTFVPQPTASISHLVCYLWGTIKPECKVQPAAPFMEQLLPASCAAAYMCSHVWWMGTDRAEGSHVPRVMVCAGLKQISLTFPRQSTFGVRLLMCCHVDCIVCMKEFCISFSLRTAMSATALTVASSGGWGGGVMTRLCMVQSWCLGCSKVFPELWATNETAEVLFCTTACKAVKHPNPKMLKFSWWTNGTRWILRRKHKGLLQRKAKSLT